VQPFRTLPREEIIRWLRSIVVRGRRFVDESRSITIPAISTYTGIPVKTLRHLVDDPDHAGCSPSRQLLLSKVIGEIENGYLRFDLVQVGFTRKRVAVHLDRPEPRPTRFRAVLSSRGPRLQIEARPPRMPSLPQIRDIKIRL